MPDPTSPNTVIDFEAWTHPVLALQCTDCQAKPGQWCKRPSGHRASEFHRTRKTQADREFIHKHGEDAWIERLPGNTWKVHKSGRAAAQQTETQS